jgi:hypothetical protein
MKFHTKQIPPEGKHFEGRTRATILELNDPGTVPLTPVRYSLDVGLSEGGLFATGESGGRPPVPLCELPRAVCPAGARGRFRLPDGLGGREEIDLTEPVREDILLAFRPSALRYGRGKVCTGRETSLGCIVRRG